MKIKIGDVFDKLKVIGRCKENKWGKPVWICKCSCDRGTILNVPDVILKRRKQNHCGCEDKLPLIRSNLKGKVFGNLTVDSFSQNKNGRSYWNCICGCGREIEVMQSDLTSGRVIYCGKCNYEEDLVGYKFNNIVVKYKLGINNSKYKETIWYCECQCEDYNGFYLTRSQIMQGVIYSCGCENPINADKVESIVGNVYGHLIVRSYVGYGKWLCKCDCGNFKVVAKGALINGEAKSCGNCIPHYKDITGQRFGNVFAVRYVNSDDKGRAVWACLCDCGKTTYMTERYLNRKDSVNIMCDDCKREIRWYKTRKDYTGDTFGNLYVVGPVGKVSHAHRTHSIWKCVCNVCGTEQEVATSTLFAHKRHGLCTCGNINTIGSSGENAIKEYISTLIDDVPVKRKILCNNTREIDLLYSNYNIGIEFNGSAFHASINGVHGDKMPEYHREKFLDALDKNIHLITIFDVDWDSKCDKIKAYLKDLFISPKALYARKCDVRCIDKNLANVFCDKYHLQGGNKQSKYHYGLYYRDDLYAVMTFGRQRRQKESVTDFELIRYCVKSGYTIIGGANRLLRAFESDYSPKYLVSYSDNDYFTGGIYSSLGFVCAGQVDSLNYYWLSKSGVELPREKCQARFLREEHPELSSEADEECVGVEDFVMSSLGARKVYRCGNTKWEKRYENNIS